MIAFGYLQLISREGWLAVVIATLIMLEDERLEVANNAYFQLIDQLHRQTLVRMRTASYQHHFVQKIQGLLYLWTAPQRGFFAFAHLLEFPEEEISTICFIPEQTQLLSDQYYQELQLANRFYTGAKRQLDEAIKHYRQALAKRTTIECLNNIGCALLQSKRFKEAKSHFLSATSLAPRAHEPFHNLAHTNIKMAFSDGLAETELKEQTEESIRLYNQSLELNPENHFAWHNIGNIHAANEEYLQAINFYLKAVSLSPKYASSLCALAHCYRCIREYSNAFDALLPLLKRSSSYSFLVTLANLLVQSSTVKTLRLNADCVVGFSEYFKSKEYFEMSVRQQLQLVRPLYQQALKMKPTSSSALTGLGNLHLLMGDYEQALQCYKKAVYFNSRCIAAHNGAALAFFCLRNYELAEIKLIDSLKISRSRLSTLLGSFVIRLKLKQTVQAAKIAEELSQLYPQNQLIYYYHSLLIKDATSREKKIIEGLKKKPLFPNNRHLSYKIIGDLMLQFGLVEEAVQYSRQAKDESLLSRYHQQLAQPQKAMDAYIKVLQQNRNNDEALFRIAELCFEYRLIESCEAVLVELLKTDRQNIKYLSLLARVKSEQKRHGEEIGICQQIVSLTSESEDALNCLALAHLKQDNLFEASRYLRLALKRDSKNWAVLNNLANISRQIEKHEEARRYYCESQKTDPECFVPFVNSAGLLPLYEAFPASESTLKTFNLCLHFLFCDQYNPCFSKLTKLAENITNQDYFEMVNTLTILQQQFPPFVEYGLLFNFLLSSFCSQSPLLSLQRLLNINESLDGFADAIQSMNYPCDGDTLSQILYLMLKQAFAVNQPEALLANHHLCQEYKQFQDYRKRKELIFWAKGQAAVRIEQLFKIIESVLSNQEKQGSQSAIHQLSYAGIHKAKRLRTLIENGQILASQIERAVYQAFSISNAKNGHYQNAFSHIIGIIEREQSKLINDLNQSSKDQKAKVFIAYYENNYFVNLFIKYSLHSFAHFIDPSLRITLAEAFLKAKCSSKGTIQILKMVMKELSIKESMSNQSPLSLLKISLEYEEKKKLSRRSEEGVSTKENTLKETSYHRQTREERRYSKLSVVFQSSISERWPSPLAQNQPQSDHSALRIKIQFNFEYQSFYLCFCETRQLCQEYLSNHSFLHFDSRQTLMKTENPLDYKQMIELGHTEIFRFIQHFSSAIIQLEEHGIYHCDLSLKNVIRIEQTFKIVDFAFVMMFENKDVKFYESTKKLIGFLFEPKTKQIKEAVVRYIFRGSDKVIQSCLLELENESLEPEEKIFSFLEKLKDHAIAYNRKLLREIINGIINTNQQTPKLFLDEIPIITQYLNQITNQPHGLKKYLEAFCVKCRNFVEHSSRLEPQ